jgi:hypothetical protein
MTPIAAATTESVGTGVQPVGNQRSRADLAADPDPVDRDQFVSREPNQAAARTTPTLAISSGLIRRGIDP